MTDITICVLGVLGILACRIIEYSMWEHDRDKALGCDFEKKKGKQ